MMSPVLGGRPFSVKLRFSPARASARAPGYQVPPRGALAKSANRKRAPAAASTAPSSGSQSSSSNSLSTLISMALPRRAAHTSAAHCRAASRCPPRVVPPGLAGARETSVGSLKPVSAASLTRMVTLEVPTGQPMSRKCGSVRSTSPKGTAGDAVGSIRRSGAADRSQCETDDPGSRGFGAYSSTRPSSSAPARRLGSTARVAFTAVALAAAGPPSTAAAGPPGPDFSAPELRSFSAPCLWSTHQDSRSPPGRTVTPMTCRKRPSRSTPVPPPSISNTRSPPVERLRASAIAADSGPASPGGGVA